MFILKRTHDLLIMLEERRRDAVHADLKAALAKCMDLEDKLRSSEASSDELRSVVKSQSQLIKKLRTDLKLVKILDSLKGLLDQQQKTIEKQSQEIIILTGARKPAPVRDQPENTYVHEVEPDVRVVDATEAQKHFSARQKMVDDARDAYNKALQELAPEIESAPEASEEALAAAIPASMEDWNREHATPATDNTDQAG